MIAADIMTDNPRTIRQTDPIRDAVEVLQSMEIRHLPVVDEEGELVGMLSDRDLGSLMRSSVDGADPQRTNVALSSRTVTDFMTSDVVSVDISAEVSAVVELMLEERIGAVPVVDGDGSVAGIISYVDVLRAVALPAEATPAGPTARRTAKSGGRVGAGSGKAAGR